MIHVADYYPAYSIVLVEVCLPWRSWIGEGLGYLSNGVSILLVSPSF